MLPTILTVLVDGGWTPLALGWDLLRLSFNSPAVAVINWLDLKGFRALEFSLHPKERIMSKVHCFFSFRAAEVMYKMMMFIFANGFASHQATLWPSGLRRCVKAAVFWAWVRIPPESNFCPFWPKSSLNSSAFHPRSKEQRELCQ